MQALQTVDDKSKSLTPFCLCFLSMNDMDIGYTLSGDIGYTSEMYRIVRNAGQGLFVGMFHRVVEAVPEGVGAKHQRPERSDGTYGLKERAACIYFFFGRFAFGV